MVNSALPTEEQIDDFASRLDAHLRAGGTLAEWVGVEDEELEAAYALAGFFYGRDEYDTALRLYGLLLMGNPHDRRFAIGMAMSKQMLEQYEDAIGYYANALAMDFDDPLPSYHIAECLMHLGKRNEALQTLTLCLSRARGPEHQAIQQRAMDLQRLLITASKSAANQEPTK